MLGAVSLASPALIKRQEYELVRGVNLGGLFVLEPWITPSLFEEWAHTPKSAVVDEWNYCAFLGKQECQRRLYQHWASWVQESDLSTLANININTIRIPIGYWALMPNLSEPYVQGQIPFLKNILSWAGKYRLRVILDLHGVPGSQNGFDNSGQRGEIRWTKDTKDIQRSLDSLAVLASIANEYPSVVAIQAVNEPANWGVSKRTITQFYNMAYSTIKAIAPHVAVVFHDAFLPQKEWADIIPRNLTDSFLDTHIYHVFVDELLELSAKEHIDKACKDGDGIGQFNDRTRTICGEFSLATTDCARWLNGFQRGARWDGSYLTKAPITEDATCHGQERIETWNSKKKQFMKTFAMAQLQAYERGSGWIFWNFKTETADEWNYMKLVEAGIIPNSPVGSEYNVCSK
ncbi:glycoside hydrolase superfamily [Coemansia spiralis]|nr:glycoside hydrolase superfamily [Coemansia spiralis]